jgi:hypothetical protein
MNDLERDILIGAGLVAPPLILAAIIAATAQAQQYVLIVTESGPGTIDITTGTHSYTGPTQVTVNATPNAGYQANWNLNGIDVEQGVNTYSVFVNGVVTLGVYFTSVGPAPGPVAGIRVVGAVGTVQNLTYNYDGNVFGGIVVQECDENWTKDAQCAPALTQFKVIDAGGNGIPNVQVAIYPDSNPDNTLFESYAVFDPTLLGLYVAYNVNNPLYLTTDSQGVVKFNMRNLYGAEGFVLDVTQAPNGYGKQLSLSTGVYGISCVPPFCVLAGNKVFPIWKGLGAGYGSSWYGGGGGGPIQYTKLIHAEVVGTAYYIETAVTVILRSRWG